nr:uncharacterized protein LOC118680845 [Bactrocera oleae]
MDQIKSRDNPREGTSPRTSHCVVRSFIELSGYTSLKKTGVASLSNRFNTLQKWMKSDDRRWACPRSHLGETPYLRIYATDIQKFDYYKGRHHVNQEPTVFCSLNPPACITEFEK